MPTPKIKVTKEHLTSLLSRIMLGAGIEPNDDDLKKVKFSSDKASIVLDASEFEDETIARSLIGKVELTVSVKSVEADGDEQLINGTYSVKVLTPITNEDIQVSYYLDESKKPKGKQLSEAAKSVKAKYTF